MVAVETSALATPMPVRASRVSASCGAPVLGSAASTANAESLAGWPPSQSPVRVSEVGLSIDLTVPYDVPEVTLRPTSSEPSGKLAPTAFVRPSAL